jgi:hypothetical protein
MMMGLEFFLIPAKGKVFLSIVETKMYPLTTTETLGIRRLLLIGAGRMPIKRRVFQWTRGNAVNQSRLGLLCTRDMQIRKDGLCISEMLARERLIKRWVFQ